MAARTANDHRNCPYPFEDEGWGIRVCFQDAFACLGSEPMKRVIYFGPPTQWPFFDGYHRFCLKEREREAKSKLLVRLRKRVRSDSHGRCQRRMSAEAEVDGIRGLKVKDIELVGYRMYGGVMQCPAVFYEVIGIKRNYEIHYPDCGMSEEFHRQSDAYIRDTVKTVRFI